MLEHVDSKTWTCKREPSITRPLAAHRVAAAHPDRKYSHAYNPEVSSLKHASQTHKRHYPETISNETPNRDKDDPLSVRDAWFWEDESRTSYKTVPQRDTSENGRRETVRVSVHHYNQHRPHTACGDQPPVSRLHASVDNVMTNYR